MEKQQFDMLMGAIGEVKTDVKDLRKEQVQHGKMLATVTSKVKSHSWIHRTTGLAFIGLFVAWIKSKLT